MDKAQKVIRGAFFEAGFSGVSREELLKAMEWEIISHSVEKGVSCGHLTARTTIALKEAFPGLSLWAVIGNNTHLDFVARVKNKKVIEEVFNLLNNYNRHWAEGCIYCKSAQCVSYTHGESVCGPVAVIPLPVEDRDVFKLLTAQIFVYLVLCGSLLIRVIQIIHPYNKGFLFMIIKGEKNMIILNLTQHQPTPSQVEVGVVNLPTEKWEDVKRLLTFASLEDANNLGYRPHALADIAEDYFLANEGEEGEECEVMIGGAPYLMTPLSEALKERGIKPLFSFTERKTVEVEKDGKTVKTSVFEHVGWVEA